MLTDTPTISAPLGRHLLPNHKLHLLDDHVGCVPVGLNPLSWFSQENTLITLGIGSKAVSIQFSSKAEGFHPNVDMSGNKELLYSQWMGI